MGLVHRQRLPNRQTGASQSDNGDEYDEASKTVSRWTPSIFPRRSITGRALVVSVGILMILRCNGCLLLPFYQEENETFRVRPIMVQSESLQFTNVTTLTLVQDPPHVIENRRNRYWINHEIHQHKDPEEVPEGCVAEADWMNENHPSCNNVHEVDMNDFFFNPQRTTIRISNGHHHRQKFRLIGKGGFRSAFLFHESDGTRRVLKTLLYRDDRSFTPRTFDRMRRDAVASEQLTASKYIVDIYGYCGMSALVDYSDSDDMLSLFKKEKTPEKDELFQIAHDVAQSVADAHHFNKQGRATIVHMDIKPNQWIKFDGRWMLNDFNVAKFLSWDPQKKKNCRFASGYSEGRVSDAMPYRYIFAKLDNSRVYQSHSTRIVASPRAIYWRVARDRKRQIRLHLDMFLIF